MYMYLYMFGNCVILFIHFYFYLFFMLLKNISITLVSCNETELGHAQRKVYKNMLTADLGIMCLLFDFVHVIDQTTFVAISRQSP